MAVFIDVLLSQGSMGNVHKGLGLGRILSYVVLRHDRGCVTSLSIEFLSRAHAFNAVMCIHVGAQTHPPPHPTPTLIGRKHSEVGGKEGPMVQTKIKNREACLALLLILL